jgi:hypothetical protein
MSKDEWRSLEFKVDLEREALNLLDFLEVIYLKNQIQDEEYVKRAIFRYEKLWLPMLASNYEKREYLYPPNDVAWIWHCHMLSPTEYKGYCLKTYGQLLGHDYKNKQARQLNTKLAWESTHNLSFEKPDVDPTAYRGFRSNISYDLLAASNRQSKFYYNVSLPHFRNATFLHMALDRYKKFINLKKSYKEEFIVPCYAIDVMWHTHQVRFYLRNDFVLIFEYEFFFRLIILN